MKRLISIMLLTALIAALSCTFTFALAEDYVDYSYEGWYEVYVVKPADHTYSYIYDRPSSTKGKNLGRVDNGEMVYGFFLTHGVNHRSSRWIYCEYNGICGYLRYDNLIYLGTDDDGYYYDYYYGDDYYRSDDSAVIRAIDPPAGFRDSSYDYVGAMFTTLDSGLLELRDEPAWTTNWSVEIPPCSLVTVYYYDEIWAYCEYMGNYGYILWEHLSED